MPWAPHPVAAAPATVHGGLPFLAMRSGALSEEGLFLGPLCAPSSPVFPRFVAVPVDAVPVDDEGGVVRDSISVVSTDACHHNIVMFRQRAAWKRGVNLGGRHGV